MRSQTRAFLSAFMVTQLLGAGVLHSAQSEDWNIIGHTDLLNRLGADVPTGAGVVVGQVEASEGGGYGPNQGSGEFAGIAFTFDSLLHLSNKADTGWRRLFGFNFLLHFLLFCW